MRSVYRAPLPLWSTTILEVREVLRACSRMLLGVLWLEDSWYDAVRSGEPRRTTMFVIRPEIARSADDEHRLEISRLRCEGGKVVASAPPT